jgi:hypothetical protein
MSEEKKSGEGKPKETKTKPKAVFPTEAEISQYSFMRIPADVMEALCIKKATLPNGKAGHEKTKVTLQSYDAATKLLTIKLAS